MEKIRDSTFFSLPKKKTNENEWALRNINIDLPRGGALGVLGHNGAGKSTLLKIIAGVTPVDRGEVIVSGSIFPMIELTAGMSMELSGRENIIILATIMGLSSKEILRITPKIEEFSELGRWIKEPVWKYSSGMVARLAFGIAVNMEADILLVDEVLAVGDIAFQKKCENAITSLLAKGTTLILVTHSSFQITRLCDKAIILKNGNIVFSGSPKDARTTYLEQMVNTRLDEDYSSGEHVIPKNYPREGTGDIIITKMTCKDADKNYTSILKTGGSYIINIYFSVTSNIDIANFAIRIMDSEHRVAISTSTSKEPPKNLEFGKGVLSWKIENMPLAAGKIDFQIKIAGSLLYDFISDALPLTIVMTAEQATESGTMGYSYLPSNIKIKKIR